MNVRTCVVAAGMALSFCPALADWSTDASTNSVIANRAVGQHQPKVRVLADGSCYVSWLGDTGDGFDTYLQRLDPSGNPVFAPNGILINDSHFSSSQDYGLAVDADGNAYVAFRDDTSGTPQCGAQKIAPDGTRQWGPNGIVLTTFAGGVNAPHVCATSDGGAVVGWSQGSGYAVQKLDASGAVQWAAGGIVTNPASGSYTLSELVGSDHGGAIALWVKGGSFTQPRHLYTQKFSSSGAQLWNGGSPRIVFDGSSIQFGNFPTFLSDGQGGAVYGWYETGGSRYVRVQRVDSTGAEVFAHNGVPAATTAGKIHLEPSIAYNPLTQEIFAIWTESFAANQNAWGVYAQKFAGGVRQWSDDGKQIVPMSANQSSFTECAISGDGMTGFWFDKPAPMKVIGTRLDGAGNFVWAGNTIQVSSTGSSKGRLDVASSGSGCSYVVWHDGRSGSDYIMGQVVTAEGALGACPGPSCPADYNNDGGVDGSDVEAFYNDWSDGLAAADVNNDGGVDGGDVEFFFVRWEAGGCN